MDETPDSTPEPTPEPAPGRQVPPGPAALAAAAAGEKKRNVVAIASFVMGLFGFVLFIAIPFPDVPEFVVTVPFFSALLAVPIGLIGAVLSWTNVFRQKDWWFGIAGAGCAVLVSIILGVLLNQAFDNMTFAPVG